MDPSIPHHNVKKEDVLLPAFQRLSRGLRRLASSMVGETSADDALQDAFVRLWTRRTPLNSEEEAGRMLTTTVRNLSIDALRRQHTIPTVELNDTDHIAEEEEDDDCESRFRAIERIIEGQLTPLQRDILHRHDYDGEDYDAIARSLQMQPAAVRMQLSRARCTIREIYRRDYEKKH